MSLVIREAVREDIPRLCQLELECFSSPWSADAFSDSMSTGDFVSFVAESDGRIIGYVGGILVLDECSVTNVAVSGSSRRMGAGSALVRELERAALARGASAIFLEVRVSNAPAISVYERLGYERCGTRRGFYTKPREDAYVYKKTLAQ